MVLAMADHRKSPAGGEALKNRYRKFKNIHLRRKKQALRFDEINAIALSSLPSLLSRWLPNGVLRGREYVALNPKRADRTMGSFKINVRTGCWCDFATGDRGGDPVSLAAYLFGLSQKDALHRVAEELGVRNAKSN